MSICYKNKESKLPLYRAIYVILCICLAVLICAGCALVEISLLRWKSQAKLNASAFENDKIRIYIDQGHNPTNYHNTGAEGNGLYEQDITSNIGCQLADMLRNDGRFEVLLSRPDKDTVLGSDVLSSLQARVNDAAEFNADYFISLHINSFTNDAANGIEVFFADDNESYSFGRSLLQGMVSSTSLNNRGMKPSSELYVLENSNMTAVLLEMGFISNSGDAQLLSESPELFAEGIYNGVVSYFKSPYTLDLNILICIITVSTILVLVLLLIRHIINKSRSNIRDSDKYNA